MDIVIGLTQQLLSDQHGLPHTREDAHVTLQLHCQ